MLDNLPSWDSRRHDTGTCSQEPTPTNRQWQHHAVANTQPQTDAREPADTRTSPAGQYDAADEDLREAIEASKRTAELEAEERRRKAWEYCQSKPLPQAPRASADQPPDLPPTSLVSSPWTATPPSYDTLSPTTAPISQTRLRSIRRKTLPVVAISQEAANDTDPPIKSPLLEVPDTGRERRPSQSSAKLSIREGSRTRSGSSAKDGEICQACQNKGPSRYFCNVCSVVYCELCWSAQMVHKINALALGSIPHEKTEHDVAKKVKEVLTPQLTERDREKLHNDDIDTTWFGVAREENELPLFRDYGRYASLIAETRLLTSNSASAVSIEQPTTESLYPSLVSFVGQTGAGKSTLIKLLIDLSKQEGEDFSTPVVGGSGRDVATSEDVHLYLDPDSSESQAPILFADCEGLEGGERDPMGAKIKRKMEKQARLDADTGAARRKQRLKHTSERELTWATTPKRRSREFAVAHLYPRLLYTFSDVIVFVLKNPRVIESVLERLVDWAAAALEKSSNQPVLPHAIIALNASENDIPEELWDVDQATKALMESLSRTVFQNHTFKKYAQFWRERHRQIETVEQLLLSYYGSLRVVRIPTTGRPNLIQSQVVKLSEMVRWASSEARHKKMELRMLLDADELQPYLQVAFDHFACNLDTPFDFVQASFTNSPIPLDFGGNILKLGLQVMECWEDEPHIAKGATIFEELSYVVASCVLLDAARHKIRGSAEAMFPQYLEHIDNALENFCDRHWPCEFISRGGRCVNVRSGHGAKGHQLKSGKLLAAGEYTSSFTFDTNQKQFQENVYFKLVALRELVRAREQEGMAEERAAADVHRESVLPLFFEHASRGNPQAFISHTVCFCCLFEPPEHALPCGHIICTHCLKTYGRLQLNRYVEIPECPLEKPEKRFRSPWKVYLKPPACGVRVLTLDGGGIRGVVELELMKAIEKELGGRLAIQSFFDLVVGTSTGAIIALGLTAKNWSVEDCTVHFQALCRQAFTPRKGMDIPLVNWIVQHYNHSKYETQPLQEALIEAFTDDQYLFGGRRTDPGSMEVKVAVTATSAAGGSVVLANYNRLCDEKVPYHFQRPEKLQEEIKTWEAARASAAAPRYFKPMCHEPSKHVYYDGGVYHNNPIVIADRERKLIWPQLREQEPDIVVSLGTAFCKTVKEKRSMWPSSQKGIISFQASLTKLATNHVHSSLDSEAAWDQFMDVKAPKKEDRARYVRLNPELNDPVPGLDAVDKMGVLQQVVRYQYGDSSVVKALARRLIATCFFFDTIGDVRENYITGTYEVTGYVHSRFIAGPDVCELGRFLKRNATAGHDPHFLIREEGGDSDVPPQEVHLDKKVINRMINDQQFRIDRGVHIRRSNKQSRTEISLCLTIGETYPISGFPRSLHADKGSPTASRSGLSATHSIRWAGRTNSQQQRRHDWKPPTYDQPSTKEDIIARYSSSDHLLGSATQEDLKAVHELHEYYAPAGTQHSFYELPAAYRTSLVEMPSAELPREALYVAKADWAADTRGKLSIKQGDTMVVDQKDASGKYMKAYQAKCGETYKTAGWWQVHRLQSPFGHGWVPESYLEPAGPNRLPSRQELDATSSSLCELP